MKRPGIIYCIPMYVVHRGASPSCGVFKDYSNMVMEITLRKEHEIKTIYYTYIWCSIWISGKEYTCQCSTHRFKPWVGRSPGEGNGNPLQYSCLENPTDRGAWWATIHGVAKRRTWLSNWAWEWSYSMVPGEGGIAHHARTTWEQRQGMGAA